MSLHTNIPDGTEVEIDDAPALGTHSAYEAEIDYDGCDMVVTHEGWEYFLVELNGPCHPGINPNWDHVSFFDDRAYVSYNDPATPDDVTDYTVKFEVRSVRRLADADEEPDADDDDEPDIWSDANEADRRLFGVSTDADADAKDSR